MNPEERGKACCCKDEQQIRNNWDGMPKLTEYIALFLIKIKTKNEE